MMTPKLGYWRLLPLFYILCCTLLSAEVKAQDGWFSTDVGTAASPGSSIYDGPTGRFTLSSNGSDVGGFADEFTFTYRSLTGDGQIIARVPVFQASSTGSKAGLMIRESLTADARNAMVFAEGSNQIKFQSRATAGVATQVGAGVAGPVPIWLRLTRAGNVVTGYSSADGVAWTSLGSTTIAFGSRVFMGLAIASRGPTSSSATFENVAAPWRNQDLGTVGLAGSTQFTSATGTFTVKGAGADIGGAADAFQFEYQALTGNGEIVAKVASVQNTNTAAKAGVMIRETLTAGSKSVFMGVTPGSGANFVYRGTTGGTTKSVAATGVAAPVWVKLSRNGSTLVGSRSADGITWTQVSSQTIAMATTVYVGLAVTSKNTAALCTSTFTNVTVIQPWAHQDIGTVGLAGRLEYTDLTGSYSLLGAGAVIGGTADGLHYTYQSLNGDGQIITRLTAQQNTGTGARAGMMFRGALTNTAQHVALLATPGGGLTFQYRSAASGATAIGATTTGVTPPVWLKLMRVGNVFSAFHSMDGVTWQGAGTQTVALPTAAFIGIAGCSGNTTALARSDYEDLVVGSVDTDGDNLPDSYEISQFGGLGQSAMGDFDRDGLSNYSEYDGNSSPSDYYNGASVIIAKIGGDDQTGAPGVFLPLPLLVEVRNTQGGLQIEAPVTFTVTGGGGLLSLSSSGSPLASTISARTDTTGRARVYYQQSSGAGVSSIIRATAGTAQVDFAESTAGTVATPTLNPDGGTFATRRLVTATTTTPGAVIRYSLSGVEPTESDPSVASGAEILVPATATLKVKGFKTAWTPSGTKSASFVMTGAVAGGYSHTLALKIDGTVAAWGLNLNGELGNGSFDPEVLPWTNPPSYIQGQMTAGPVVGLSEVVAIAANNTSSLALKGDGTVWGWGSNGYGQIGASSGGRIVTPEKVQGLSGVIAIAMGDSHSLLVKSDGTVWLMGSVNASVFWTAGAAPVQVAGLSGIKAVAAGGGHSVALKSDGTVWCWGANTGGQLGNGGTRAIATPVQASGLSGVIAVATGFNHSLALKGDGTVWAWGVNTDAQLGDGTQVNKSTPTRVSGLTGVTAIASGLYHSLALKADGVAWHWGKNNYGQSVSGFNNLVMLTPVQVRITSGDIVAIGAGDDHTLVIRREGSVWGGGFNYYGALGTGSRYLKEYFAVQAVNINVLAKVDAPLFAPQPQSPDGSFRPVRITCATPGATIRYTTTGQDPSLSDPVIVSGGTVNVPLPGTLKARAWFTNMLPSTVTMASYDGDRDGDGLSDNNELSLGTNPAKRDSDGDGIDDNVELANGTDPRVNNSFNDPDRDGLTTAEEALLGTDPNISNLPGGGSGVLRLHTPLEVL